MKQINQFFGVIAAGIVFVAIFAVIGVAGSALFKTYDKTKPREAMASEKTEDSDQPGEQESGSSGSSEEPTAEDGASEAAANVGEPSPGEEGNPAANADQTQQPAEQQPAEQEPAKQEPAQQEPAQQGQTQPSDPQGSAGKTPNAGSSPLSLAPLTTARTDGAVTFTLATTGDTLVHGPVLASAKRYAKPGDYNFVPLMAPILPFLYNADVTICNLETPVATPDVPPTGYPTFNAPIQIVRDLKRVGVDGCSLANNHSLDKGFAALSNTIHTMDAFKLSHSGTARSAEEYQRDGWLTLQKDGRLINIAHISGTYGTNGIPAPRGKEWAVQLLNAKQLIEKAKRAREKGAHVVLVSLHDGVEYNDQPTKSQQTLAQQLADSRLVDLVIGNHTHVPMSAAKLGGGPNGMGMWTIWGHGNLFSNQDFRCCNRKTTAGLIYTTTITVPAQGPANVDKVEWTSFANDTQAGHRLFLLQGPGSLTDPQGRPAQARLSQDHVVWLNNHLSQLMSGVPQRLTPVMPSGAEIVDVQHK